MKLLLCCPYYNEKLISKIQIEEASKWADEIHITECTKNFKYKDHALDFAYADMPKVHYHVIDGKKHFLPTNKFLPHFFIKRPSRWMKHYCFYTGWCNEAILRNFTLANSNYSDDDIIVLSDIDEIIDHKDMDFIITEVQKYGVVTLKMYFSQFYFNLFCDTFSGPSEFSYRVFAIKGKIMRELFHNDSDYLRKSGEGGRLKDTVHLVENVKGFHHSWLGDEKFVLNKLNSYAHLMSDHDAGRICTKGEYDISKIKQCLINGESLFPNVHLYVDNSIKFLDSVVSLRSTHPHYFL